jgi:hypothetical protein
MLVSFFFMEFSAALSRKVNSSESHAIAQVVSRQLPTTVAQV